MVKQNNRLAVVIPAYKRKYLKETLDSLKSQTNQAFSLYIGDDNSPENLWEVIKEFTTDLQIEYKKFDSNWGGGDLVGHWNRCIDLVGDEEWIWLFSDDDCMDTNCVEVFYNHINSNPDQVLIHFNVKVIDHNSKEIPHYEQLNNFGTFMSSKDFFKAKILGNIHSYVVEYVFHKKLLSKYGKFVNFDLAWCSDDATWIKFAQETGINTVKGAAVSWRLSGINISSKNEPAIVRRKLDAKLSYFIWVRLILGRLPLNKLHIIKWFFIELDEDKTLNFASKLRLAFKYSNHLWDIGTAIFATTYIAYKNVRIKMALLTK